MNLNKTHYAKVEDGKVVEMANAEILLAPDAKGKSKTEKEVIAKGWWPVYQSDKNLDHDPATQEVAEMFDIQENDRQVVWVRNVVEIERPPKPVSREEFEALKEHVEAVKALYTDHRDRMDTALHTAERAAGLTNDVQTTLDLFRDIINKPGARIVVPGGGGAGGTGKPR